MSIVLRNRQLLTLVILTIVTALILVLTLHAAFAHVNGWHTLFTLGGTKPDAFYPYN
jgi:hypothetical protein